MNTFAFWQKWLLGVSLYLAAFGIILALFPQSPLMDSLFNDHINTAFWPEGTLPGTAAVFQAWIYGVLGATVAGWGVLIAFIVHVPFKRREKWAWNCIAGSFVLWYLVDTSLSAFHGVLFNVYFNTALFLLVTVPLGFARRHFPR